MTVTHRGHNARILNRGECGWDNCPHGHACIELELEDGRIINTNATEVLIDGKPIELPGQLTIMDAAV